MQIANPNLPGSLCHQKFSSYVAWYKDKSSEYLVGRHANLIEESKDYLRLSGQSMANSQFEAECVSHIHEALFGTPLQGESA
jgi:hypothetical protein